MYLGLSVLKLIIVHNPSMIGTYKSRILDCFTSSDYTIKKQGLWLLGSLATAKNLKEIVNEIM